jgi:hypothetical protein
MSCGGVKLVSEKIWVMLRADAGGYRGRVLSGRPAAFPDSAVILADQYKISGAKRRKFPTYPLSGKEQRVIRFLMLRSCRSVRQSSQGNENMR